MPRKRSRSLRNPVPAFGSNYCEGPTPATRSWDGVFAAEEFFPRNVRPVPMKERERFLVLVSEGFSIARAAEAIGKPRASFQKALDEDPVFQEAFLAAFEASCDKLEDEAWRRSFEREKNRRGSDKLLEMSLRARRPWRWGERLQVSGPGGGPVKSVVVSVDHAEVLGMLEQVGLVGRRELEGGG